MYTETAFKNSKIVLRTSEKKEILQKPEIRNFYENNIFSIHRDIF